MTTRGQLIGEKKDQDVPIVDHDAVVQENFGEENEVSGAVSLECAVKEHPLEISNNHDMKTLVSSIDNILDSGVEKVVLKVSERTGKIEVDENCYKSISCNMVKVKSIGSCGEFSSKSEAKFHIETSYWHFPCPDYKFSNIKRNLEKAICSITGVRNVEVKSFSTGIVEYD